LAPSRIFVKVSRNSRYISSSDETIINAALETLQIPREDATPLRHLVTKYWGVATLLVFDLFHPSYDYDTAHLVEKNRLKVQAVHLRRVKNETTAASTALCDKVNKEVAEAHNLTGYGAELPFRIYYTDGNVPVWRHSRDPSLYPTYR
jgi:hypothetical protein